MSDYDEKPKTLVTLVEQIYLLDPEMDTKHGTEYEAVKQAQEIAKRAIPIAKAQEAVIEAVRNHIYCCAKHLDSPGERQIREALENLDEVSRK